MKLHEQIYKHNNKLWCPCNDCKLEKINTDSWFHFYKYENKVTETVEPIAPVVEQILPLDKDLYDLKMKELVNNPVPPVPKPIIKKVKDPKTGKITEVSTPAPVVIPKPNLWPVNAVYPNAGAILPFKRVIAYYGNLYSKKMGALGEYPEDEMLARLNAEVKKWELADPSTPVLSALHYVAVTAQGTPSDGGKYISHMPFAEIDKIIKMAEKNNSIVFLDVQVGFSNLQTELPKLEKYLKMPQVHLGIDPEFSMKGDKRPGKVVGTFDASDINFAAEYLAKLVKENNLTPKILVIHRYTGKMVTNSQDIKALPEVQIVIHMDGWGNKDKKITTYKQFVYKEPVQFTGFKIFYKNDTKDTGTTVFTPEELMKLNPRPIYIQYQ
ncbi:MAG: hypothetical protein WCG45_01105 [bacterium]